MAKKILAMLLAAAMAASVCACSSSSSSSSSAASSEDSSEASTEDTTEESTEESGEDADTFEVEGLTWTKGSAYEQDAVAGETDDRAFAKFDEEVEVHIARQIDPVDTTLGEGEDAENNMYTRYLSDTFNIKTVVDWTAGNASDFNQKVSLAIASADLPDGVVVTSRTYLVKAARAGLVADLHDVFDATASVQVKGILETTDGRAYSNATVDGVFCALPNVSVDTDGVHVLFIRQDWLDQLGLEVPKTVSDIETVAKAFMDAGLSTDYAIAGTAQGGRTYTTFLTSSNNGYGFDPVYESMGATPGYWLQDENGEVYYGTNTEEMKSALELLANWYAEGLIDPELGISTNGDNANNVKAGTCGIWFGPWWGLGYGNGDSFRNDPTADWQAYPVYSEDGTWNVKMKDCGTSYTIVSAEASEDVQKAIMIMNNSLVRDESLLIAEADSPAIDWWPLRNTMAAADECEYEVIELTKVLKGETTPEDYNIPGTNYKNLYSDASTLYEVISADYNPDEQLHVTDMDVNTNNSQFNRFYALFIGDRPYATVPVDSKTYSIIYSTTDAMDTYWSSLLDLEDQTVLSIITGKADISSFDEYIENWNAQGGAEVIESVKEMVG